MGTQIRSDGRNVKGLPGFSAMRERFREMVEDSSVTGSCECGEFVFEGALRDERAAFRAHVELAHPERLAALDSKRPVQPMSSPKPTGYGLLDRLEALRVAA